MRKSVFDSGSEKKLFNRLKTSWNRYVDVFPQVPVRGVAEYESIKNFEGNPELSEFLLKTSFDFVVCELNTGIPILVVEFDGLSGGFSCDGQFHISTPPKNDKHRKLKMDAKLRFCSAFQIPMVAISYPESELLTESEDWISILDVIIGDALEKRNHEKNYSDYVNKISEAYEYGGKESAEMATIEIDVINEQSNPIKKKIKSITKDFPFWPYQIIFPIEQDKWLSGTFELTNVFRKNSHLDVEAVIHVEIKMRRVGVHKSDGIFLFNTIGEYCLARKVQKELGADKSKWSDYLRKLN